MIKRPSDYSIIASPHHNYAVLVWDRELKRFAFIKPDQRNKTYYPSKSYVLDDYDDYEQLPRYQLKNGYLFPISMDLPLISSWDEDAVMGWINHNATEERGVPPEWHSQQQSKAAQTRAKSTRQQHQDDYYSGYYARHGKDSNELFFHI